MNELERAFTEAIITRGFDPDYLDGAGTVPGLSSLPANGVLTSVFPPSGTNANIDAGGNASVTVPAQSVQVFVVPI